MTSSVILTLITIIVIIAATVAVSSAQEKPQTFSKIITVGPVWATNTWSCVSDEDFVVHGTIRALGDAQLAIAISDLGTQSFYTFTPSNLYSFTLGGPADHTMTLTKTGTVTGWLTLQTMSNANATCTQSG